MEAEIDARDYWDMTYKEIIETIKAYNRRKKADMQFQASIQYRLADLIGASVGRLLDDKIKLPPIEEAFPTLFDDIIEKQTRKQQDWRIMKERMKDFASQHNKKNK